MQERNQNLGLSFYIPILIEKELKYDCNGTIHGTLPDELIEQIVSIDKKISEIINKRKQFRSSIDEKTI